MFASTLFIRGKSRMREIRSYGSVRGVVGNRYPYRDWFLRSTGILASVPEHGKECPVLPHM